MLEAKNITFAYEGSDRVLFEEFSMSVGSTERVALQAPSGFGKTTLCRVLAGYDKPRAGEVLVDGERLPARGRCPVQLIGQHPELAVDPRMRMKSTLEEGGVVSDEVLGQIGIQAKWLSRFPHELSGGELQRFCIARALAAHPKYLIADEISTMLDAVTQAQIWKFLLDYLQANEIGLVFVSHSPALTSRIATRVIEFG